MCNQQPAWARSREFEITTRSIGRGNSKTAGDLEDEEEEEEVVVNGKKKRRVSFMPSIGMSGDSDPYMLRYNN